LLSFCRTIRFSHAGGSYRNGRDGCDQPEAPAARLTRLARVAAIDEVAEQQVVQVLDHGFVRLDAAMADDLSVVNAARVSFARRKEVMDESDEGLVRFLMRDRHGTPFEHNAFRFHIRCPIFVAREWFRHRIGCLTGDTRVTFVDTNGHANSQLTRTIDDLWRMWTTGEKNGHALPESVAHEVDEFAAAGVSTRAIARRLGVGRRVTRHLAGTNALRDARWLVRRMKLRVLDEETNEFTTGHVSSIVDKGVQPVYRLTLADGKELTLTENHRLLTDRGWSTMRESVGLVGSGEDAVMTRPCSLMVNGLPAHRDRDWLLSRRQAGMSVREIAGEAGCSGFAVDAPAPVRKGWKLTAHPVRVVDVAYVGMRETYDLCVDGPWHNFVANGVVVHNSFNEFSMRYAKATDDFYVPAPEDVRTQVGKPGSYSFEPVDPELAERARKELESVYDAAYAAYERLTEAGVARELARSVMPVGAYTEFYWTVNARALMNFISLRNAETAQREIRRYAEACETFLEAHMPVTYVAFVANDRIAP